MRRRRPIASFAFCSRLSRLLPGLVLASGIASCGRPAATYRFDDHLDEAKLITRYESPAGGESPGPPPYDFDQDGEAGGWTGSSDFGPAVVKDGLLVLDAAASTAPPEDSTAEIRSPELDVNLDRVREIDLRMKFRGARFFRIGWETAAPGLPPETPADESLLTKSAPQQNEVTHYRISTQGMRRGPGSRLRRLLIRFQQGKVPHVEIDTVRFSTGGAGYFERPSGPCQEMIAGQMRRGFFLRSPGALAFDPGRRLGEADLSVGLGLLEPSTGGVEFVVATETGGRETEVFRRRLTSSESWEEARVRLPASPAAGRRIVFRVESSAPGGEAALWATPFLAERAGRSKRPASALVYLVDALRADELGVMGHAPSVTPNLDSIARSGTLFRRCYSTTSWTRPAVASLLTSLYPDTHGVREGEHALADAAQTLFEAARRQGYLTAIFTAQPHAGSNSNFHQGVDFVFEPSSLLDRVDRDHLGAPSSDRLNAAFFRWLDTYGDAGLPFLAYLHSLDVHDPYWPPVEQGARFVPGYEGPGGPQGELHQRWNEKDVARLRGLYDAELEFNDGRIGELVQRLDEKGLDRRTLLVLLADHGEEFHEHGRWGHGQSLNEVVLHIPLVFSFPGKIPKGRVVDTPISIVDVAPTILATLGLEPLDTFQGVNLAGILANPARPAPPRPIFASFQFRQFAILDGPWKLVEFANGKRMLFDVVRDPAEGQNLVDREPDRTAGLKEELRRWREAQAIAFQALAARTEKNRETLLDVEANEAIRALGYVQ